MLGNKYKELEKNIISNTDRFSLTKKQIKELKNDLNKSTILITGAAGSIGSIFIKRILKFNFKNLILIDKDENQLTELNRELVISSNKKTITNIRFICTDLNLFNLHEFIKSFSITHYFNFAAVKHVRSEEEYESINYMFKTNSYSFLPFLKLNKKTKLKKIFSISTDKVANPTSLLGISKSLMEERLAEFKAKNKHIHVSTVRFANVSFSNGSILKYIDDRIREKKVFGIPKNIGRYFITHQEASSLCLKAILSSNDNFILTPDENLFNEISSIKDLSEKIMSYYNLKPVYKKSKKMKKNELFVSLNNQNTHGQKNYEEFYSNNEVPLSFNDEKNLRQIKLKKRINTSYVLELLFKSKSKAEHLKIVKGIYKDYKIKRDVIAVSKII